MISLDTAKFLFQVERKEISYLRWIFESYDGMAFLTTIDPDRTWIELKVSHGCEKMIIELLDTLRKDECIQLTPLETFEFFMNR